MTNGEMIKELRKPGKVYMPVCSANDVTHIAIEKSDLISILQDRDVNADCDWTFYGMFNGGRKLDINT